MALTESKTRDSKDELTHQTRRINQLHRSSVELEIHQNGVARGVRHGRSDQALGTCQRVDQRRLAHVGTTNHSQLRTKNTKIST